MQGYGRRWSSQRADAETIRLERDAERQRVRAFATDLEAVTRDKRQLTAACKRAETELDGLRRDHDRMLASTSWRVTAPLRVAGNAVKRMRLPSWRLERWLGRGRSERLVRRSQLFDTAWYLEEYPDVAAACLEPVRHFLDKGWREGRNPSSAFDTADYLERHLDVARAGANPLVHYLRRGQREGREIHPPAERLVRRSQLFDPAWYLEEYPDVAAAGLDPVRHFLDKGWREGRNPSSAFDTADYLERHLDVARAGANPLVHYLRRGQREGRESTLPPSDWCGARSSSTRPGTWRNTPMSPRPASIPSGIFWTRAGAKAAIHPRLSTPPTT